MYVGVRVAVCRSSNRSEERDRVERQDNCHGSNRSLRLDFSEVVRMRYGCLAVSRVPSELLLR